MRVSSFLLLAGLAGGVCAGQPNSAKSSAPPLIASFEKAVKPVLGGSCVACHNDRTAAGNLDVAPYMTVQSLAEGREGWEKILRKVRNGEMPPKGIPKPPKEQVDAMTRFVEGEFERADRNVKPDPGRVTARRLNRNEYSNTIRDLVDVDYRAQRDFPTDDSGYGFDNIGDVLTISPILMEKYVSAAEQIASRALGADPLPKKPLEVQYHAKEKKIRRLDRSTIEASHRVEWDGEYVITIGMPGERGPDAKPVTLGFSMDGKLLNSVEVDTKPSGLVYFNPYSDKQMRLYLPAGDHTFRAGFIGDDFVKSLATDKEAYSSKKNKYLDSITFVGPYKSDVERPSRKKILICDPKTGMACVDRIMTALAHRAYRRPVTKAEVASLVRFVNMAKADGQSVEQGLQLAIEAMLVSPHFLFRIEHDPNATDPALVHKISDVELASRLSYFLWSSMPDEELQNLAETGKLRAAGVLDAQVKRMLADSKSSAFAENFAGQWLEIRNLDTVRPDPQKFPEWGPELKDAMRAETSMFFEAMLRENRPLSDFLNANFTFLNERLAKHYGIAGVSGPDFRRVELTTNQRGGILTQASVLTVSSYPTRTSVVIRGKYVLNNILGAPPPPPPADVPTLDEDSVGTSASLRQQMEKHRSDAVCASCHTKMDPLGFGLENYDGTGKWRTKDGKFDVDASGTLPGGKTFTGPAEMKVALNDILPDFSRCMIEKLMTYGLGRGLERYDRRTVEEINRTLASSGYPFQSMVFEIVKSLPFQSRRGEYTTQKVQKPKEIAIR